jgi:tetratricopeptide (TPR) repeat protein
MNGGAVNWGPAVGVLLFGLVLGAFLLLRLRRSGETSSRVGSLLRKDLERRFDELIVELRELDDTAAKFTDEQRDAERTRLERAAAIVLRELDSFAPEELPSVSGESQQAATPPQNKALKRLIWLTGATVSAAVIYVLLLQFAVPRDEAVPMTGGEAAATTDPELAALQESVRLSPDDPERRIALARAYLERRDMAAVDRESAYVLQRIPTHARALSYQALVHLSAGDEAGALQLAKSALQSDPDLLEGWIHLAIVQYQLGDRAAAMKALDLATQRHPESAQTLSILRKEMEAGAQSAAATATPLFSGSVELSNGTAPSGAVVFITLRAAGITSGPPAAVKRLPADHFPLDFSFSAADSMRGEPLPDTGRVEARIDSDGDPLTRNESDPSAVMDGVKSGTTGVRLLLK